MKFTTAILLGLVLVVHQSTQRKIAPRIVGGSEARARQFPYAAAVYIQKTGFTTFCGGALLSNLWTLTAANCLFEAIQVSVHLGSNTLSGPDSNRLVVATDGFVTHPNFDPDSLSSDVGLIKFRSSIRLDDWIQPISFFPIADLPSSARVTTLGWGQLNDETPGLTNNLHFVKLTTITNTECPKLTFGSQMLDGMVCVTGHYNKGICLGDNGGPLIQNVGIGHTLIVGIASFVSTNGCECTDPSTYTRVFPYKEWISNVTEVQ